MEALLALFFTFGLMWLLLIRPQQRRMRAHQQLVAAIEPGDEVVTAGGIHGTVTAVGGDDVRVEVAPGVVIRVLRGAISQRSGPFREDEADEADETEEVDEVDELDEVDEVEDEVLEEDAIDVEPERPRKTADEDGS